MKILALIALTALCWMPVDAAPLKYLDQGGGLNVPTDMDLALCTSLTNCGPVKHFTVGTFVNCGRFMFAAPTGAPENGLICVRDPVAAIPPPVLVYRDVCLPEAKVDFWNIEFETGDVAPGVSTEYPKYVVWRDACSKKIEARVYSYAEGYEFVSLKFKSNTELNAWGKAQVLSPETPAEAAFLKQLRNAYAIKLGVAPPVIPQPLPKYVVTTIAAGTRPYYKANTANTAISTKLGDVAVGTLCDGTKRLGTTNKYWVPSKGGYAECVLVP